MQLMEHNALISVTFELTETLFNNPGDLKMTIDCFTTLSLHSADILLNGETILTKAEV